MERDRVDECGAESVWKRSSSLWRSAGRWGTERCQTDVVRNVFLLRRAVSGIGAQVCLQVICWFCVGSRLTVSFSLLTFIWSSTDTTRVAATTLGLNGTGSWLATPANVVTFANATQPTTDFSVAAGTPDSAVILSWSQSCLGSPKKSSFTTFIVSSPSAISGGASPLLACGSEGVIIAAQLTGDASDGAWTGFEPGRVDNNKSASTTFRWDAAQVGTTVTLSFSPNSVCSVPATVKVQISSVCPLNLPSAAVAGISVGAVLAVGLAALATVILYRFWNRAKVNLRSAGASEPMLDHTYYRF